jgi:hypothetical protein
MNYLTAWQLNAILLKGGIDHNQDNTDLCGNCRYILLICGRRLPDSCIKRD